MHLGAEPLADELGHRHPPPLGREIDRAALDLDLGAAGRFLGGANDQSLGQLHHALVVGERLVGLEHREFGIVTAIEAFVAKDAADLVDPLDATDDELLERQLECDPQVHVDVERVVVGGERSCRGAARRGSEHRGLDLDEVAVGKLGPQRGDRGRADREDPPDVRVEHQVEVALAVAQVGVGRAVDLLRDLAMRPREQLPLRDADRELAAPRGQHRAGGADPVAHI